MDISETFNLITDQLLTREETVAVAESVTAGSIAWYLSQATNATSFFQGGITVYNLGQKTRHLGIDPIYAEKVNSVSELISQQMAVEVSKNFCSQWGIGITGYAAPVPELNVKICYAWYSISYRQEAVFTTCVEYDNNVPREVQKHFTKTVLKSFAELLKERSK